MPSACLVCRRRRLLLLLCATLLALPAAAAEQKDKQFVNLADEGLTKRDCWLYLPKGLDKAKVYPLVVFLHAAGLRGTHLSSPWVDLAAKTGEFVVLVPQCRDERTSMWRISDEGELLENIKAVMAKHNVDPTRILLTGFSHGGVWAYTFGLRNPKVFRAVAVMSGGLVARPSPAADRILQGARHVPFYVVHGTADDRIPVERARASRDRLEQYGYQVAYREIPHWGHAYPSGETQRIWEWFKQVTAPAPEDKEPAGQQGKPESGRVRE